MPVLAVNSSAEFDKLVHPGQTKGVFVDFFAEWCGPCKMVAPKLEELSNAHPDVIFIKVDVDQAQDLAQKFAVRAMPTFMAFYKGEKIGDCVGADLSKIGKLIEELKKTQPFAGEAKTLGGSTAAPAADDAAAAREARAKAAEARLAAMSGAGST